MGMDNQVVLTSFVHEMDAQMMVLELQAAGIHASIRKDDCGGMRPWINNERGVEVMVPTTDLDRAAEVVELHQLPSRPEAVPEKIRRGISKVELIALLVLGLAAGWTIHWVYMRQNYFALSDEIDRNNDGITDLVWTYDKDGYCTGGQGDDNFDGAWDIWYHYLDGRLVSMDSDTDFNNVVDAHSTFLNGVLVKRVIRPNGSTFPVSIETYQHGVFRKERMDTDGDGVLDLEKVYDAFGGLEESRALSVE